MILEWLERRVTKKIHAEAYRGPRAALLPFDLMLSYAAKRSYPTYRAWYRFHEASARWFYGARSAPRAEYPGHWLDDIQQRGRAVVPASFPTAAVDEARAFVLERYAAMRREAARRDPDGKQPRLTWRDDDIHHEVDRRTGRHRLYFAADLPRRRGWPRLFAEFADNPAWLTLARDYFATDDIEVNSPYLMAEVMEPGPDIERWHIDCVRPTLKSFLYLGDVTPAQGPLWYLPSSHRVDEEKHRLFYDILRCGLGKAYFEEPENRRLDAACERLVAPAGTNILFDTRGLHAGSLCTDGLRVALVTGFRPATTLRVHPRMFRDPEPATYPWERREAPRP